MHRHIRPTADLRVRRNPEGGGQSWIVVVPPYLHGLIFAPGEGQTAHAKPYRSRVQHCLPDSLRA